MELIEVDYLGAESLQTRVTGLADVFARPVHTDEDAIGVPDLAKLGCQYDLVAILIQCLCKELFIPAESIDVSRVEQRQAKLDRSANRAHRLRRVSLPVELGHPHAPEPERGDGQTSDTQRSGLCTARGFQCLPANDVSWALRLNNPK
jgi:hypothetical protein